MADRCGIYEIQCRVSGKKYVGSSCRIYQRWIDHRESLNKGVHHSSRLQRAWLKHGSGSFSFVVLEDCSRDELVMREQFWIDKEKPEYNCSLRAANPLLNPASKAKRKATILMKITHCPMGHEYTPENTHISTKGKRLCRACNALRVAKIYANETPEQRELRRQKAAANHAANRERRLAKAREYTAAHKAEKAAYDREYRKTYVRVRAK